MVPMDLGPMGLQMLGHPLAAQPMMLHALSGQQLGAHGHPLMCGQPVAPNMTMPAPTMRGTPLPVAQMLPTGADKAFTNAAAYGLAPPAQKGSGGCCAAQQMPQMAVRQMPVQQPAQASRQANGAARADRASAKVVNPEGLTAFFQAVIGYLAEKHKGSAHASDLGQDPNIKAHWLALHIAKSKKMTQVLDTRPDLFSRFMTKQQKPVVKLEPLAFKCVPPNPLPPLDPSLAEAAKAKPTHLPAPDAQPKGKGKASKHEATGLSHSGGRLSQAEARKVFFMNVLPTLAAQPEGTCDLALIGSIPTVQDAWNASKVDKKLNIVDVLKERPDLIRVNVDDQACTLLTLTELGTACARTHEVPDPDPVLCPPVTAVQDRGKGKSGKGASRGKGNGNGKGKGKGKGKGRGTRHSDGDINPAPRRNDGPDLPRERLSDNQITGEVLEWKGRFGWVRPTDPIEHPMASKHNSRVYVNEKDLVDTKSLDAGNKVQFFAYSDESGIGAEECAVIE